MTLAVDTGGTFPFLPELCLRTGLLCWDLSQLLFTEGRSPPELTLVPAELQGMTQLRGQDTLS